MSRISNASSTKFQRIVFGNEHVFTKPLAVTSFGDLPHMIKVGILTDAAVSLRLSSGSCETFGEVYERLALVCKEWQGLLRDDRFFAQVKRQTFARDPLCRYLRKVQPVPVSGFEPCYTRCAVTLGDRLYVTEEVAKFSSRKRIFVYDMDDGIVQNTDRQKRQMILSNKRELAMNGLSDCTDFVVPCARTNTIYAVQYDSEENADVNATVHKVRPEDGAILVRWRLDVPWFSINHISLSSSGSLLTVASNRRVFVYDTSSGTLVKTRDVTCGNKSKQQIFVAATLLDESPESLITVLSKKYDCHKRENLVVDDHQCRILMTRLRFTIFDNRSDRKAEIRTNKWMPYCLKAFCHWYDKERGLVFCPNSRGLRVLRITH